MRRWGWVGAAGLAAAAVPAWAPDAAFAQVEGIIDQATARQRFDDAQQRFEQSLKSAKKRQELAGRTQDKASLRRLCDAFQRDIRIAREGLAEMDSLEEDAFDEVGGTDGDHKQLDALANEGCPKGAGYQVTSKEGLDAKQRIDRLVVQVRAASDDKIARDARIADLKSERDRLKSLIDLERDPTAKSDFQHLLADTEATIENVEFGPADAGGYRYKREAGEAPGGNAAEPPSGFSAPDDARPQPLGASNVSFSVGGHYTLAKLPTFDGGTQFDSSVGTEVPIGESEDDLKGWGVDASLQWRKSDRLKLYVNFTYDEFDGASSATVPVGGNPVATTYIFPNPNGGSTGLLAGPSGQEVRILTEADLIDIVAGLDFGHKVDWKWLGTGSVDGYEIEKGKAIGFHYRRFDRDDFFTQQNLTFTDVNSMTTLWSGVDFYGAQFAGALTRKPADGSGPFFGGRATVSIGAARTEWKAEQNSNCGACGSASSEFNVQLAAEESETKFAWIGGVSVFLGYQFNPNALIELGGSYERMSKTPDFSVPTTPTEQPIGFGYDDMWTGRAGGRFTYSF